MDDSVRARLVVDVPSEGLSGQGIIRPRDHQERLPMTVHKLAVAGVQHPAFFTSGVAAADPALHAALQDELTRQQNQIELIASENIVSRAVLEAQGSILTNK